MKHRTYFSPRHPPPWWPENEDWPPRRSRHWRWMGSHNPFFRRLGCLFVAFNLIGTAFFLAIVGLVLNALNIIHISLAQFQWITPAAGIFIAFAITLIITAALNLRRLSMPLDDLLNASNHVAEGDYSIRLEEKGPPEVRSLTRSFNSMTERLQAVDRQRRSMLADVTHELRTPLTIIQGNLEGILDGMYPADEERLNSVLEETQLLSRLVEDLRTLSLAESGALQLKRDPTDIALLIRETVSGFKSQADASEVKIEMLLGDDQLVIEIDAERIRQVLLNLISNAMRYSPRAGVVKVGLRVSDSSLERGAIISVEDNGPGITPDDLPHVFDRFYKSGDSRGMGLGLSIAKFLVEAHGGRIQAESQPGKRTTISFTLPY